ncbi:polyprenol phosphomannose-dependent alpha 1,6 mannosyltransferase MptB [Krasilnikovia sp. MM14-A1259]|uniref:polyprenol phosphomannose-dependent alpha 1,6 mannosyltransferase MptB n=1 Tax=Krasilnikovia sp. MM14-A1259 TaxID=3373539 RepID=UPI0037FB287A
MTAALHHAARPVTRTRIGGTPWRRPAAAGTVAAAALTVATSGLLAPTAFVVAVSLVAMGGLVLAWLTVRRQLTALTETHMYGLAAAWALPLAVARPLFSGDVWSYLAQGLTAAGGLDPYRLGPARALGSASAVTQHVSHYWVDTPAPYGPAWLTISRAVAMVAGERLAASVLLYRLIAVAGVVLIAWALPRLARRVGTSPTVALWLGLLNPLVLWHLVAGAHNDAIMLGLMLTGLELALAGRDRMVPELARGAGPARRGPGVSPAHGLSCGSAAPARGRAATALLGTDTGLWPAGLAARAKTHGWGRFAAGAALLTIAANIKIVAAVAVCCLAVAIARRHVRPALVLLAGAVAGTALLSAVAGFGWLTAVRSSATVYSWMAPTTAIGLLIGALVGAHVTATAVTIGNLVGVAICVPVVVRLLAAVHRGRAHPLRALGLIFVAALVCGPVVQPWYLLWAVLPLAVTARGRRERSIVAAVSAVVAMLLPPLAAGVGALVAGYLAAAVAFGVVVLARRCVPAGDHRLRTLSRSPKWTPVERLPRRAGEYQAAS